MMLTSDSHEKQTPPSFPMTRPRFLLRLVLLTLVLLPPGRALAAAGSMESIQNAANQWAKIRAENSRLDNDWRLERELLDTTELALTERIRTLEQRRSLLESEASVRERKTAEIGTKHAEAEAMLAEADGRIAALSEKLIALRPWLPPRLSSALEFSYRSLQDPKLSPGERVQVIVSLLNRGQQFNRSITYSEEVLSGDAVDRNQLLEVVYWGLGQAFAFDRSSGTAYRGAPGAEGWTWEKRPDVAAATARLIAVYKDQADPQFTVVPASIAEIAAPAARAAKSP